MKKSIVFIATICCTILANYTFAGTKGTYKLTESVSLVRCDVYGNNPTTAKTTLPSDYLIQAMGENGSNVIIKVLRMGKANDLEYSKERLLATKKAKTALYSDFNTKYVLDEDGNETYYLFPKSDFDKQTEVLKSHLTFGALTLPIKVRFPTPRGADGTRLKYLDFDNNLSIGANLCWTINPNTVKPYYLSFVGGLSLSSIAVDSASTKGVQKTASKQSALTLNVGGMITYNDIQIMLTGGWDFIGGKVGDNWNRQGNFWLGVGIGYNIFTVKTSKDKN